MTSSVVGLRRSCKALPKAKLAASLIHYSFLNPSETITSEKYAQQIDEMYQKLQHLQPALINRKGPILLHYSAQLHITQPMLQKLNKLGYEVLPHLSYSPDLSPTEYHLFKHLDNFLQGKCFHNQLLLLLSRVSHVQLCATPQTAAHQAPPSLGFSRQEHWSGLPFPSPTWPINDDIFVLSNVQPGLSTALFSKHPGLSPLMIRQQQQTGAHASGP